MIQTVEMQKNDQESDELDPEFVAAVINQMLVLLELPACVNIQEGRCSIKIALTLNVSHAQYDAILEQAIAHAHRNLNGEFPSGYSESHNL